MEEDFFFQCLSFVTLVWLGSRCSIRVKWTLSSFRFPTDTDCGLWNTNSTSHVWKGAVHARSELLCSVFLFHRVMLSVCGCCVCCLFYLSVCSLSICCLSALYCVCSLSAAWCVCCLSAVSVSNVCVCCVCLSALCCVCCLSAAWCVFCFLSVCSLLCMCLSLSLCVCVSLSALCCVSLSLCLQPGVSLSLSVSSVCVCCDDSCRYLSLFCILLETF